MVQNNDELIPTKVKSVLSSFTEQGDHASFLFLKNSQAFLNYLNLTKPAVYVNVCMKLISKGQIGCSLA